MNPAPGFTLVELIVTLVVLGVMLSVVALAAGTQRRSMEGDVPRRIAVARERALAGGGAVTIVFGAGDSVTLYPDGSATAALLRDGSGEWSIDPWTAEVRRAHR